VLFEGSKKVKGWAWRWLAVLVVGFGSPWLVGRSAVKASDPKWVSLSVEGHEARIFRDAYGVPHIFAPTDRSLFYAYGYAIAQDRLWQLDLFRRTARGTLAEILGPLATASDLNERRHGYTELEHQEIFVSLTPEAQAILAAYSDGINAYLSLALADPGRLGVPAAFLPA
jgi:penicillin amidase